MIISETEISAECARNPGIGRLVAYRRIQARRRVMEEQRRKGWGYVFGDRTDSGRRMGDRVCCLAE